MTPNTGYHPRAGRRSSASSPRSYPACSRRACPALRRRLRERPGERAPRDVRAYRDELDAGFFLKRVARSHPDVCYDFSHNYTYVILEHTSWPRKPLRLPRAIDVLVGEASARAPGGAAPGGRGPALRSARGDPGGRAVPSDAARALARVRPWRGRVRPGGWRGALDAERPGLPRHPRHRPLRGVARPSPANRRPRRRLEVGGRGRRQRA